MSYNPPTQTVVDNDTKNAPSNEAIFEALKNKADTNLQNLSFSGSNGNVLTLVAGVPAWAALPASGVTAVTASSPLASSGGTTPNITIQVANASQNGYLSSTDWSTFNSKENALTFSAPLSRAVNTVSIPVATSLVDGYLSAADWSTFNSKMTNPMTTAGDIIVGGVSGAPGRLALGTVDKVLVSDGTAVSYQYAGLGGGALGTNNVILGRAKPAGWTTASENVLIGVDAGQGVTTAKRNVFVGRGAGYTTSVNGVGDNVYIGDKAGYGMGGIACVGIGVEALGTPALTGAGSYNVAIGYYALRSNNSSANVNNIGIGAFAGQNITSGSNNIAIGQNALDKLTTGVRNYGIGYQAFNATVTGTDNIGMGHTAFALLTNGSYNIGIGSSVLPNATSAARNVFIGHGSGNNIAGGTDNVYVGYQTRPTTDVSASIAIGAFALAGSNEMGIGSANAQINTIYVGKGGATQTTANAVKIMTQQASGTDTDLSAATLTLAGSRSTGNKAGGDVIISTAPAGTSGTTLNAHSERMRVAANGNVGVGTANVGTDGINLAQSFNLAWQQSSTESVPNIFRQNTSACTVVASGLKYSTTANGFASSYASSWAKAAIVIGNTSGIRFYTDTATTVATGTDVTPTERMRLDTSGYLLVGYTSSNGAYNLQVNSQIFATSSTIATSDGNYKENVKPLENCLDSVMQLNPVQFSWKEHPVHKFDRSTPTVGFIAQEVQETLKDAEYINSIVKKNECTLESGDKEEFLGIAEGNMIAILTKAIQELKQLVDQQSAKIEELEAKLK